MMHHHRGVAVRLWVCPRMRAPSFRAAPARAPDGGAGRRARRARCRGRRPPRSSPRGGVRRQGRRRPAPDGRRDGGGSRARPTWGGVVVLPSPPTSSSCRCGRRRPYVHGRFLAPSEAGPRRWSSRVGREASARPFCRKCHLAGRSPPPLLSPLRLRREGCGTALWERCAASDGWFRFRHRGAAQEVGAKPRP